MKLCVLVLGVSVFAACDRAEGGPAAMLQKKAPRADCPLIAQILTSLEMGNYAERDVRAPREAELAKRCRDADLTDEEAQCLRNASTETLAYCPKPLAVDHRDMPKLAVDGSGLPQSCQRYLAALEHLGMCPKLPIESRRAMTDAAHQAAAAWRQMASNAAAIASLNTACEQGATAIQQSMTSVGCQ